MLFEMMYNTMGWSVGPLMLLVISAVMALHNLIEVPPQPVYDKIAIELQRMSKSKEEFDQHMRNYQSEVEKYYSKANFWVVMGKVSAVVIVIINFVEVVILNQVI